MEKAFLGCYLKKENSAQVIFYCQEILAKGYLQYSDAVSKSPSNRLWLAMVKSHSQTKKKEGVIFSLGIGDERWNVRNVSWAMGEPGREKARAKLTGSGMTTGRVGYTSVEGK